jgi:Cytochrome P460
MRQISLFLVAIAMVAGMIAPRNGRADDQAAPMFLTSIPPRYRDWRVISVAHEEGNLHSLGVILGNDVAIKAYREGTLPYPDGTIIAALHYRHAPSGGKRQSLWPGPIFRCRPSYQHSVYGQGLNKVRQDGRLGVRSFPRRQARRRGVDEDLLPLPRPSQNSRPCLHPLRTLRPRTNCFARVTERK